MTLLVSGRCALESASYMPVVRPGLPEPTVKQDRNLEGKNSCRAGEGKHYLKPWAL